MSSSIFDTPDGEGFKSDKPNVFAKFTPEAQAAAAKQALGGNDKEWRDRRERCWSCKLEDCVSEVAKKYPHSTWEGRKDGSEANQKGGEDHVKPVMDRWHKDEQRVLGAMRRAREEQEARRLAKASMTPEEKAKKDKEREEKKALQAVEREKRKKAAEEKKAKAAVEREKRAKEKAEAKSKAAEHRRKVVEEKRKVAEAKKVATMSQRAQVRRSAKNQSGGPMSTGRAAVPEPATEGDDAGATVLAGLKSAQHGQTVTKTDVPSRSRSSSPEILYLGTWPRREANSQHAQAKALLALLVQHGERDLVQRPDEEETPFEDPDSVRPLGPCMGVEHFDCCVSFEREN